MSFCRCGVSRIWPGAIAVPARAEISLRAFRFLFYFFPRASPAMHRCSSTQIAETGMPIRPPPQRPMKEQFGLANRQIVDAGMAMMHDALGIKLPVFVAVRAVKLSGIVVPLISEAHGDPGAVERPHFLDEAVVQLAIPFARQELNNLLPAVDEFGPIAPLAVDCVCQRNSLRVTRIPTVLRSPNFFDGSLTREGWRQTDLGLSCHWIAPFLHPLDRDWFEGRGYIFYPYQR